MLTAKRNILYIIAIIICIGLTSCRRTVLVMNSVTTESQPVDSELWNFIRDNLLGREFSIGLIVFLLVALLLWKNGYRILEWFKQRPMSAKIVTIIVFLTILFSIGCISHDLNSQHYGGWFALPVTMTIGSTVMITWSLFLRYQYRMGKNGALHKLPDAFRRQRNLVLLAKIMIWIWSCGWTFYFIAISIGKQPHVGAEVLLRSAIASLDLFLMDIDSNILDAIQYHDVLKGMITCAGFAAVICTTTLILSLVLARLMAHLHIKHIRIDEKYNHVNLFFGINEASKLLANDIYTKDPSSVIIFVEDSLIDNTDNNEDKTDSWKNIVNMFTHKHKTFSDVAEDERRALAISNCSICSINFETTDILGNIGLETVKRILWDLDKTKNGLLNIFLLSEDRDSNVRSTSILAKDLMIGSKNYQTTIHCHARRNGINKIIEDLGISPEKRIDVKIIDSSYLAVEHLKADKRNHPVNYVQVKTLKDANPGSVSSAFTSLVVGFGETGQEAMSFLYEYGAFVDEHATAESSFRSPFKCYVVDNNIGLTEGNLITSLPGIDICKSESMENDSSINLFSYDFRSTEFYEEVLSKIVSGLNYVIVAVGDDELNMTVAIDILRYVRRYRENLNDFTIYVRAYEKGTFKHINEIAKHYNERLEDAKIVLFGQNEHIYTYELIVKDKYKEDGRAYYETYRSLNIDPSNDEGSWDKRRNDTLSSHKKTKWENLSKLRRKESQDRSNALHSHTKLMILEKAVGTDNVNNFIDRALGHRQGRQASIKYDGLNDKENILMLNLAMCEHLRWNAAHELLGYINNNIDHECNEIKKMHNCLKPWELLDQEADAISYIDDYKVFDFGVVETTFKIKNEEIK